MAIRRGCAIGCGQNRDEEINVSTETSSTTKAVSAIRVALGIAGVVALIVGILILLWPGHTAAVVTAIIAIYAIVGGIAYAALGIFSKSTRGWSRVGHIVLGVVFIAAGIIALTRLAATTTGLFIFVGLLIGIIWIIEGIVSFTSISSTRSKALTVIFAILSILAGVVMLLSPLFSVVLWLLIGIALVVLGIVQIVRAATWKAPEAAI
jgi:uncharacterized membrane protein HdeD (DUF308 family)